MQKTGLRSMAFLILKIMLLFSPIVVSATSKPNHNLYVKTGAASFYGSESGTITATGERFNPNGLTAAHRTLRFGTKVRVTNTTNKKSVVVVINDRGPYHGNRIIDLAKGAAQRIGLTTSGVGRVRIEELN
jgi:rare lipoprotein A